MTITRVRVLALLFFGMFSGCAAFHPIQGVPARYLPPELRAPSRSNGSTIDLSLLSQTPPPQHLVGAGDVLGIYIEGVLGRLGEAPPISVPSTPDLPPSIGYPITIRDDGTLSLPMIGSIPVQGMTIRQVEDLLRQRYTVDRKILQPGQDRIIVSLQRPRQVRVLVLRQETGGPGGTEFAQGLALNLGQSKRGNGQLVHLPVYHNDVLHALARTGGLPGLDAENAIYIVRSRNRGACKNMNAPGACCPIPAAGGYAPNGGYQQFQPPMMSPGFQGQVSLQNNPGIIPVAYHQPSANPLDELRHGMHPQTDMGNPILRQPAMDNSIQLRSPQSVELSADEMRALRPGGSSYQWGTPVQPGLPIENYAQQPVQVPTHNFQSNPPVTQPQWTPPVQQGMPQAAGMVPSQPTYSSGMAPSQLPYSTDSAPSQWSHSTNNTSSQWPQSTDLAPSMTAVPLQEPVPPVMSAPMAPTPWQQQAPYAPQNWSGPQSFAAIPWEQFAEETGWNMGDPTMNNREIIKIPVRLKPGQNPNISTSDIILEEGDIVFIESRETEIFYTGGLLGGGQYTLPRDYDLDVLGAIAIAQGSGRQQSVGKQLGGVSAFNGDVTISASKVIILRQLPNGGQVPINVDLYRAIKDPAERILIQPGDIVMLRYKPMEAVGAFIERNLLESALFGLAASQLQSGGGN
ncbi:MAG: polysaccharide biosynthesis/export family protein [Planctomycetaceae bacterium]|nr:polysaccharide biosynthesis/export family protein [Planctomycetaceae bacterium]